MVSIEKTADQPVTSAKPAGPGPASAGKPTGQTPVPIRLGRSVIGPTVFAILIVAVFLGGFGAWAALAPLSSAAIATGVVSPDGNRRTIQHLEGGIIREILVSEGDVVLLDDPVMVLEDVTSRAERDMRESRLHVFRTLEARLETELLDGNALVFPDDLIALGADDPVVARAIDDQRRQFQVRNGAMENRQQILEARVAQLQEEIAGREAQIVSQERQLELIEREIADVESLVSRGLERMPRLLSLQRTEAEIAGDIGENQAAIAQAEQAIGETQLQMIELVSSRREENAESLASVRAEMTTIS